MGANNPHRHHMPNHIARAAIMLALLLFANLCGGF